MTKRVKLLMHYAGYLTALFTFCVYAAIMWKLTKMDALEIVITYGVFLYYPSVCVPFLIVGGEEE